MVVGVGAGVGVALGHLPFLAGAARSLADTAQHVVGSGGGRVVTAVASHGAPRRTVVALTVVFAVLLPGVTALLLVMAARGTLRLRALVGLGLVALGAASYLYQPKGVASGEMVLALVAAAIAVAATGPLVVAPLAGLAGLIGAEFLPQLVSSSPTLAAAGVDAFHHAVTGRPGLPVGWQVVLLVVAAVPFAFAARLVLRR